MEIPSGRIVKDWLGSYLHLTANLEANQSYHLWSGLCVLAAASRRKVYLDMDYGRVFPNLYVILVGESAVTRKSGAMDYAKDLYTDTFPTAKVMQDSMTAQGLIKQLNRPTQVIKDGKITQIQQSDVFVHADEIANLFGYDRTRASTMVIFFTRTYTCPPVYDHTTVRDSQVRLHNLYPVLLGGTDPRNLKVFPDDAVAGLTGRLIWVTETNRRSNKSGWKQPHSRSALERQLLREVLIHDLKHISNLEGEFFPSPDAQALYDAWYADLAKRDDKNPNIRAFFHRCHNTALHLAMLLTISQSDKLIIEKRTMQAAIALIEKQLPEVNRVAMLGGGSDFEQLRSKLLLFMMNNGGVVRQKQAINHLGRDMNTITELMRTLVADGTIEIPPVRIGSGEAFLRITKEGLSQLSAKEG